jgi:hypothetical protein
MSNFTHSIGNNTLMMPSKNGQGLGVNFNKRRRENNKIVKNIVPATCNATFKKSYKKIK